MTTLDRSDPVAVAFTAFAAVAGAASLAFAVRIATANTAGAGMTGGEIAGSAGMTSGGTAGALGMMGGSGVFPVLFFAFLAFAALLALGYVGIRALADAGDSDPVDEGAGSDEELDPIARLQRRYIEGELTEAEFERALERELGGEETDGGIDPDATDESDIGGASAERSVSGRKC